MPKNLEGRPETYVNPVYPYSFPDPFVLKFRGKYFGYCTGEASDGNVFGIIRSDDLVRWEYVGSAMEPLGSKPPFYWAPEVIYDNGKFYLYYSAGNEILMEIRVAVSGRPDGGFVDAGVRLTKEDFAIDAHVFIDSDGSRYLFYATDFLEHSHIGTGTVVDRMVDWKTLEGNPRPVTRAKYDWQVYDPVRKEKGGVRWHTVEGPTILKRKGKYFEMFSGGNWQNKSYGVSFAVTDSMNFDDEWKQFSDGKRTLPILRTIPDKVVGPGHNSVVRGPNNRELYCIYHRWTEAGRVLAIDRMDFAGDRLFVAGPTTTEQVAPFQPKREINRHENSDGWTKNDRELVSLDKDLCSISIPNTDTPFLFQCTFRFQDIQEASSFGFRLGTAREQTVFQFSPLKLKASLTSADGKVSDITLPAGFDGLSDHLLQIDSGVGSTKVMIDDSNVIAANSCNLTGLQLISQNAIVSMSAIDVTPGFEELFETTSPKLTNAFVIENGTSSIENGRMTVSPSGSSPIQIRLKIAFESFELAANLALVASAGKYGLTLLDNLGGVSAHLTAIVTDEKMMFSLNGHAIEISLPDSFVGTEYRQFKLVYTGENLAAYLDGILLGGHRTTAFFDQAAIFSDSSLAVEAIRLTSI